MTVRIVVMLALCSFGLTACIQNGLLGCKQSPHRYCPPK